MSTTYDTAVLLREMEGPDPLYRFKDAPIRKVTATSVVSNNQILLNINSGANTFIDYSALSTGISWLQKTSIPVTIASYNVNSQYPAYMWAPKVAGYMSFIDKVAITVNGQNVSASAEGLAIYNWLRYMRSVSLDFHRRVGPLIGMSGMPVEEDLEAWIDYTGGSLGASVSHCCIVRQCPEPARVLTEGNQKVLPDAGTINNSNLLSLSGNSRFTNRSLLARCQNVSVTNDTIRSVLNANTVTISGATTNLTYTYNTYCYLPLRFLHMFFEKLGVMAGLDIKLTLTFNNVASMKPVADAAGATVHYPGGGVATVSLLGGQNCCPIQMTDVSASLPSVIVGLPGLAGSSDGTGQLIAPAASLARFAGTDGTTTPANAFYPLLNSYAGREQAPEVYLQEVIPFAANLQEFASMTKDIRYTDHSLFVLPAASVGASITWAIVSGAQGISRASIMGFRAAGATVSGLDYRTDCVSNQPFFSSPLFNLENPVFNIANTNVNPEPIYNASRDFAQNWCVFGVNGSQSAEISSGLYSKKAYDRSKIYTADLSHYTQDNSSCSLVFRANNPAPAGALDLVAVVETDWLVRIKSRNGDFALVEPQQAGPAALVLA